MIAGKGNLLPAICGLLFCIGCSTARHSFDPERKIAKDKLQQDYRVFRKILEENHPSLYWYTSKDSMDYYFSTCYSGITDSMTLLQFKTMLSYVAAKINCGHTTVRSPKSYLHYLQAAHQRQFPLNIKLWKDSAVVYDNLNRKDSILQRGTVLKTINGKPVSFYRDSLFQFISMDGYGISHKYQTLSNWGAFGGWYKNVFGLKDTLTIGYLNDKGEEASTLLSLFDPRSDTIAPAQLQGLGKGLRKAVKQGPYPAERNIEIDTSASTAYVTIGTFMPGKNLTGFIRRTFRTLHRQHIQNLVMDVRVNGGGNVGISNLLTRFTVDHRFKIADSLYAISRRSSYSKYIGHYFWNRLAMQFITHKAADGRYHFGYFERHYFEPKKRNHFDGDIYLVTGGNSFSATALFAEALKGQKNVTIVGEETGGGAYGNTAWLIPDVTLPNTGIRFRLPRFRLVVNKSLVKNGRGVMPDVPAGASLESIRNETDPKMEKVKELINERKNGMARH